MDTVLSAHRFKAGFQGNKTTDPFHSTPLHSPSPPCPPPALSTLSKVRPHCPQQRSTPLLTPLFRPDLLRHGKHHNQGRVDGQAGDHDVRLSPTRQSLACSHSRAHDSTKLQHTMLRRKTTASVPLWIMQSQQPPRPFNSHEKQPNSSSTRRGRPRPRCPPTRDWRITNLSKRWESTSARLRNRHASSDSLIPLKWGLL